jgi:DNA polymerase
MMNFEERGKALGQLNAGVNACHACPLGATRTRAVPGEGPVDAEIMFIGEAPGYYEDQQGRPFVGAAGQFLEQLLESIGYKRNQVFIANVVKCRPPGNRDPLPEEIGNCSHWLDEQQEILSPKVVVTLGRYSLARFLPGTPIGRIHGQGKKVGDVWVVPMYHPAAALHQGSLRATIENDFRRIPQYLDLARREEASRQPEPVAAAPAAPEATQGKLF